MLFVKLCFSEWLKHELRVQRSEDILSDAQRWGTNVCIFIWNVNKYHCSIRLLVFKESLVFLGSLLCFSQEYQQWACLELYLTRLKEEGGFEGDMKELCSHLIGAIMDQQLRCVKISNPESERISFKSLSVVYFCRSFPEKF